MVTLFFKRCRARKNRDAGDIFWGRCDLPIGHDGDHELERGFMPATWPNTKEIR